MSKKEFSFTDKEIKNKVDKALKSKPKDLIMPEVNWKYLMRSALRGENILLIGYTGCGKTESAFAITKALKRNDRFFFINLGSTQDPRASLIGNTHYNKDKGTFFCGSEFVKAIQIPHSIILLDELSRAHPEAINILMTVLDKRQRYLRLDEAVDSPTIKVAEGVTFIATANIGSEFTSTRVMDRALLDRFTAIIEVPVLNDVQEFELLKMKYPTIDDKLLKAISEIAHFTRQDVKLDDPRLSTIISTRSTLEMGSLINDGFKFSEIMEVSVFPFFSKDGGADSERTFIMQKVQQYGHLDHIDDPDVELPKTDKKNIDINVDGDLFDLSNDVF